VIEVVCPAVHETLADHDLPLPNDKVNPDRLFSGQRFVRHVAKDARWSPWRIAGLEARDTGIAAATNGLAAVRVIRSSSEHTGTIRHSGEFLFFFVLRGELGMRNDKLGSHQLHENASCVIPAGAQFELTAQAGLEMLEVALPPD
jgi:mannose-6-phosphate isomerase-like protein (cupin superfamily)